MSQQPTPPESLTTNLGATVEDNQNSITAGPRKTLRRGDRSMKIYEVECGAVITLTAQDMQKAALHGAAAIKDNPHLIYVRAIRERNFEPAREDPGTKNSQEDSIFATLPTCPTF
jgi:hypothetical protein